MAAADSITGRSPAFQFYPNDFLSDANVIVMSLHERGAYITLLCVCWQQGTLPNNVEQLARFCGSPVPAFRKLWPAVEKCFRVSGDRLTHQRLDRERKKQRDYRKLQSDKGKASAASRKATTVQPDSNRGSTAVQPDTGSPVQPKANSSSSSSIFGLQSSDSRQKAAEADGRSSRPIYTSDRFAVFEWQLDELSKTLGPHFEAFGLDEFFDRLTQQSRKDGLVIPKDERWEWLQAELLAEVKRRGLPIASSAPTPIDRKARERAQDERILADIQQERAVRAVR